MAALAVSLTLYDHIHELLDLLEEAENAPAEEQEQYDLAIREEIVGTKEKVDRCGCCLSQWEGIDKAVTAEIQRLRKRQRSVRGKIARLKANMLFCMGVAGLKRLEGIVCGFTARRNAAKLDIFDDTLIPASFRRIVETIELDEDLVRAALDRNEDVPGARLVQSSSLLRR